MPAGSGASGSPKIGTGPAWGVSHRVSRSSALRKGGCRSVVESLQCVGGAERVEAFGRVALLLFVGPACRRGARFAPSSGANGSAGAPRVPRRATAAGRGTATFGSTRPVCGIVLFDDVGEHELVTVPRNRADEARLARVVVEHAPDRADRLAQRAVGDDDVVPDRVEDVAAMDGFAAAFDEKDEQIEIARDERLLAACRGAGARRRGDRMKSLKR